MKRSIGRRLARRIAAAPPWAVLAVGWCYVLVYAFPGVMTQDSFDHLREARDRLYSDAHPPAISLLWSVTDYVIAGPFGLLVIQNTCFLAGLYLVLRRVFGPRGAAWVATGVYLFPPVMVLFAVIWKDTLMAGFLMLGVAALLSSRRGVRVAGLVAMFAATAVRYNTMAATLPLIVLLFEWRPGLPWLKRYALSTAAWLAVTLGAFRFNAAITDHEMQTWTVFAVFDIAGTLAFVDEDLSDAELEAHLAGTDLLVHRNIHAVICSLYTPTDVLPLINDPVQALWGIPITGYVPAPEAQRDGIARAWKDSIITWPGAYLKHRLSVMYEVLGFGESKASGAIAKRDFKWTGYVHQIGLGTGWSKLQRQLTKFNRLLARDTPLFSVWMYLAVALALLPLALRHRDVLALLLSGLGIEATLFLLAASPDYRYSHWLVTCTVVSAIALGVRRRARVSSPAAADRDRAPRAGSPSPGPDP